MSNNTTASNTTATPSSATPIIPASEVGYQWVGFLGVLINVLLACVSFWRICVHHTAHPPFCACSPKRLFHWLIFRGRLFLLPVYLGILIYGEFNLFDYSLHTLNNVFQSAALAIVIKEWAFVIAVLRQHKGSNNNNNNSMYSSSNRNDSLLKDGGSTGHVKGGRSGAYDSSDNARQASWTAPRGEAPHHLSTEKGMSTQVMFVRTVAIVYVAVFVVLCLAAFIACASGPYDLMNPVDTGTFFRTSTHVVYISLNTFWEATIAFVFLIYGISLRQSLIENSPPRSQGRVRKTLCRINMVVVVSAACSFLRLGLHIRSLFGRNARTDPQWITELTYYILYDFVGRGFPVVILLILMRNPEQSYGKAKESEGGGTGGKVGNGDDRRGGSGSMYGGGGGQRNGGWSSGDDHGQYDDWPSSIENRSQYGTVSDGSVGSPGSGGGGHHTKNSQSMGSDFGRETT
jgi:uncharacterized membrane protein YgcG